MNKLNKLIDDTLSNQARKKIGKPQPDHTNTLFEQINMINLMVEVMLHIKIHYPSVFEKAYREVIKSDNR